ncbi:hypothetical protein BaRGS_00027511 [Batillaria attramentaria]|uniref:DUF2796 domain-containing protein n=1 Tax=Batillaria attramentaria TaxID=370345 RepID=A0ABD0K1R7_9CAEN
MRAEWIAVALILMVSLPQPLLAAPAQHDSHKHAEGTPATTGHTATCQLGSEQIDFLMKFSLELPAYVEIGGHKFKLNIGMPQPGPPPDGHPPAHQ